MKKYLFGLVCFTGGALFLFAVAAAGVGRASPHIFIEPQAGFDSYITAAIIKKNVPVILTANKEAASFVLTSKVEKREESTGSKIARCLFVYCAGMEGIQTATVQLINLRSQQIVWAYSVHKGSAKAYQSTAEAIAKHLKEFLVGHPLQDPPDGTPIKSGTQTPPDS